MWKRKRKGEQKTANDSQRVSRSGPCASLAWRKSGQQPWKGKEHQLCSHPHPKRRRTHPDFTNTQRCQAHSGEFKYKNKERDSPRFEFKKEGGKKKQPFPILPFLTTPTPALLSPPPPPSSLRDWLYLKNYISAQAFKNAECLKQRSRISMFLTASWQLCGPRPASN